MPVMSKPRSLCYLYPAIPLPGIKVKIDGQINTFKKKYSVSCLIFKFNRLDSFLKKLFMFINFEIRCLHKLLVSDVIYIRYGPKFIITPLVSCFFTI